MNLNELVYNLAIWRATLKTFQDATECLMEYCEKAEIQCETLLLAIGEAAVAIGKVQPHPAVKVVAHDESGAELGYPRVEIERDLTPWLANPHPCGDCQAQPDECEGVPGVECWLLDRKLKGETRHE